MQESALRSGASAHVPAGEEISNRVPFLIIGKVIREGIDDIPAVKAASDDLEVLDAEIFVVATDVGVFQEHFAIAHALHESIGLGCGLMTTDEAGSSSLELSLADIRVMFGAEWAFWLAILVDHHLDARCGFKLRDKGVVTRAIVVEDDSVVLRKVVLHLFDGLAGARRRGYELEAGKARAYRVGYFVRIEDHPVAIVPGEHFKDHVLVSAAAEHVCREMLVGESHVAADPVTVDLGNKLLDLHLRHLVAYVVATSAKSASGKSAINRIDPNPVKLYLRMRGRQVDERHDDVSELCESGYFVSNHGSFLWACLVGSYYKRLCLSADEGERIMFGWR